MNASPSEVVKQPSNRKNWRSKPHAVMERFAGVAAYLMQGPRSCRELAGRLGIAYSGNNLVTLLDVMREKGVVHVAGWRHTGPNGTSKLVPLYAWQPAPFRLPDEPKPQRKRNGRKTPEQDDAPAVV
ncbi:hypothetical protein [Piscinibacter sp. XHJ-5]|uniref:hypothetical protein n=1 Tax=Piscinibacter sp. XHJ-5 TaxID=3037797 RepID=UPI0024534176|nr:hypothetical protein [Piscinibacter sp. XHJ-5]